MAPGASHDAFPFASPSARAFFSFLATACSLLNGLAPLSSPVTIKGGKIECCREGKHAATTRINDLRSATRVLNVGSKRQILEINDLCATGPRRVLITRNTTQELLQI